MSGLPRHAVVVMRSLDAVAAVRTIPVNDGPLSDPVESGNTPPIYVYSGWAPMTVPDSEPGANDGTMARLTALAAAGTIELYLGPAEGGVHPTWRDDAGWIDPVEP